MLSELETKLIALAFDTRTPEPEAVVAFLKARQLIPAHKLSTNSKGKKKSITLQSIPSCIYVWAFNLLYSLAAEYKVGDFQVNIKAAKANPKSALIGDLEIGFEDLERNSKIVEVVSEQIIKLANEQHEERRQSQRKLTSLFQ